MRKEGTNERRTDGRTDGRKGRTKGKDVSANQPEIRGRYLLPRVQSPDGEGKWVDAGAPVSVQEPRPQVP